MIHKVDNTIEEKYIELANKRVADIHAAMLHVGLYDILGCDTPRTCRYFPRLMMACW